MTSMESFVSRLVNLPSIDCILGNAIKLYEENIAVQCGYSFIEQQKNECENFTQGIALACGIFFVYLCF